MIFKRRAQAKLSQQTHPDKAAKQGQKRGVNDAFCTECKSWYDTGNQAQVNKHAH